VGEFDTGKRTAGGAAYDADAIHQALAGRGTFFYRDYSSFTFPAASYEQDCFRRGEFPLWNPYCNMGIPFLAQFTDVAESAGLRAPTIYGGISRKNYIVETMGCGCALLDYDNDGWLDLLTANGSIEAQPARLNEKFPYDERNLLFRNLRNGRFARARRPCTWPPISACSIS
jgi:hypothetical protein